MNCNCSIFSWPYVNCENIIKFQQNKKAGGILIHNDKVLLIQSRGNMWGFPKGSIEKDESTLECAIREVNEETSLLILFTPNDKQYFFNNIVLYVKHLQKVPQFDLEKIRNHKNNDCSGIGWFNLQCLKKIQNDIKNRKKNKINSQPYRHNSSDYIRSNICTNIKMNSSLKKFIKLL